jgi:hypothetical protein
MDILLVDIGGYFRLNYHRLFMVINGYILMSIGGHFINDYWWVLLVILL